MTGQGLWGFRAGERVLVRPPAAGRASRRGVVLGSEESGLLLVRVEHNPATSTLPPTVVFHDTPAFYAWLDAEIPPSGASPAPANFGRRRSVLTALYADNPHLTA